MDDLTFTLNSPITDEQWDAITDVDFDKTDRIGFITKNGKQVEFVKRKTGKWEMRTDPYGFFDTIPVCSVCGCTNKWREKYPYCPTCGARMECEQDE